MQSLLSPLQVPSRQKAFRAVAAWTCAMVGPLLIAVIFHFYRGLDAQPIGLMLFMSVPVAAAILGGLYPALLAAAVSAGAANYTLFEPVGTFHLHGKVAVYTLIIFALVALSVSLVVGLASQRARHAERAQLVASALITLAEDTLRSGGGVRGLLAHTQKVFGQEHVWLAEARGSEWFELAGSGPAGAEHGSETAHVRSFTDAEGTRALFAQGAPVPEDSMYLFDIFARQISEVWDLAQMRENAEVAEQKATQEELRLSLLAALSHDLRTPLSGAKTAIQTMRSHEQKLDASDREFLLATIETSVDELTRILQNLLDQTRIRTGAVRAMLEVVSLDEVIPRSVNQVATAHPDAPKIEFKMPEPAPMVVTDAGLLERIIANLLENSIRHGVKPGSLPPLIKVEGVCPHKVEIQVVDHGPGVDAITRTSLFQAFQRNGDVPRGTGLGLGLAVAQGLASALGSNIEASDTLGGGLTMTFRLTTSQPQRQIGQIQSDVHSDRHCTPENGAHA